LDEREAPECATSSTSPAVAPIRFPLPPELRAFGAGASLAAPLPRMARRAILPPHRVRAGLAIARRLAWASACSAMNILGDALRDTPPTCVGAAARGARETPVHWVGVDVGGTFTRDGAASTASCAWRPGSPTRSGSRPVIWWKCSVGTPRRSARGCASRTWLRRVKSRSTLSVGGSSASAPGTVSRSGASRPRRPRLPARAGSEGRAVSRAQARAQGPAAGGGHARDSDDSRRRAGLPQGGGHVPRDGAGGAGSHPALPAG